MTTQKLPSGRVLRFEDINCTECETHLCEAQNGEGVICCMPATYALAIDDGCALVMVCDGHTLEDYEAQFVTA